MRKMKGGLRMAHYNAPMFRLSREVRFSVNSQADSQLSGRASNSYGGFPSLTGAGQYFSLAVTVAGELDGSSSYLLNIKDVDKAVRERVIPVMTQRVRSGKFGAGGNVVLEAFSILQKTWPNVRVEALKVNLTPFLSLAVHEQEQSMVRLSQKFEFSASHRLHNPALSDEQNRAMFGKCNNPHGHGHNYEVQVTLLGKPDDNGVVVPVPDMERIVAETVIEPFDHKNLNVEIAEFKNVMPSVENIARVSYRLRKPKFQSPPAKLASVTVWETPKTWCEYCE
jgi:6-pyruvoyltetrahydropterin/6-carboxytetrahydropterin synthase